MTYEITAASYLHICDFMILLIQILQDQKYLESYITDVISMKLITGRESLVLATLTNNQ